MYQSYTKAKCVLKYINNCVKKKQAIYIVLTSFSYKFESRMNLPRILVKKIANNCVPKILPLSLSFLHYLKGCQIEPLSLSLSLPLSSSKHFVLANVKYRQSPSKLLQTLNQIYKKPSLDNTRTRRYHHQGPKIYPCDK